MNIHVVLVRTEHSANVGACVRAMANMGVERLILVDAKCPLDASARAMAAGAQELLLDVIRYPDWKSFFAVEGEGLRIAMTRRGGRKRKVAGLQEQLKEIVGESGVVKTAAGETVDNLYLVFGPEADGLDSADLAMMNFSCHLPVFGEFASFNLSQAVLLTLFMVRQQFPPVGRVKQVTGKPDSPVAPFYFPDQLIRDWIKAMGFDVGARRSSAYLTLRRLFLQNQPTAHELRVLEAILQQNIRKLSTAAPAKIQ
jgi:TrmH family RNA methyltransferase